ncbi:unnamed protein product [Choristocarpus tenellus]
MVKDENIEQWDDVWYFDTGCSAHMTDSLIALIEQRPVSRKSVTVGTGQKLRASMVGNLPLCFIQNEKVYDFFLCNVLLVPELNFNLFSMVQAGLQSGGETHWRRESSLKLTPSAGEPPPIFSSTLGKNFDLFTLKARRRMPAKPTLPRRPTPPYPPDETEVAFVLGGTVSQEGVGGVSFVQDGDGSIDLAQEGARRADFAQDEAGVVGISIEKD